MNVAAKLLFSFFLLALSINAAEINLPVSYSALKNGLRLIMVPDTNVAVVSCRLYYFVGSMYESSGYTGLSHMFEHMMFKGTKHLGTTDYAKEIPYMTAIDSLDQLAYNREQALGHPDSVLQGYRKQITEVLAKQRKYIKKDEIWELYQNNGGTHLNAWTADNMTAYIVTLPKNKVELFYWIESDRMRDPVLREFTSERDVVMEERRMRIDNKPDGRYGERLNALFDIASPYRTPTIGWPSDIRGYTRSKLEQHVHRFYTPDNAVIILVGNIDTVKAKRDVERYFGSIPPAPQPKQEPITREPAPIGETRYTVYDHAAPISTCSFIRRAIRIPIFTGWTWSKASCRDTAGGFTTVWSIVKGSARPLTYRMNCVSLTAASRFPPTLTPEQTRPGSNGLSEKNLPGSQRSRRPMMKCGG